jgi:hypothetical protein
MATNLSGSSPAASGGFLRWWLDELGAAMPRRRAGAAAPAGAASCSGPGAASPRWSRSCAATGAGRGRWAPWRCRPALRPCSATDRRPREPVLPPEGAGWPTCYGRRNAGRDPVVLLVGEGRSLLCVDVLPAGAEADPRPHHAAPGRAAHALAAGRVLAGYGCSAGGRTATSRCCWPRRRERRRADARPPGRLRDRGRRRRRGGRGRRAGRLDLLGRAATGGGAARTSRPSCWPPCWWPACWRPEGWPGGSCGSCGASSRPGASSRRRSTGGSRTCRSSAPASTRCASRPASSPGASARRPRRWSCSRC